MIATSEWFNEASPEEKKMLELETQQGIEERRYKVAAAERYAKDMGINFSSGYWRGYCLFQVGYVPPTQIEKFNARQFGLAFQEEHGDAWVQAIIDSRKGRSEPT